MSSPQMPSDEAVKLFTKSCINFIKMNHGEKSEQIKINYWWHIETICKNQNLPGEACIRIIFEEVLMKQPSIWKTKNLFFSIFNFCKSVDERIVQNNFFELLNGYFKFYEKTFYFFSAFWIDVALDLFFFSPKDGNVRVNLQIDFFSKWIDCDMIWFQGIFDNYLFSNNEVVDKIWNDKEPTYVELIKIWITKYLALKQCEKVYHVFKEWTVSERTTDKNYVYLFKSILEFINDTVFNIMINNTPKAVKPENRGQNQLHNFIFWTTKLLIIYKQQNIQWDSGSSLIETFILNTMNLVVKDGIYNNEWFNIIFDYYTDSGQISVQGIFPIFVYKIIQKVYLNNQLEYLYNNIVSTFTPIYQCIINKQLKLNNQMPNSVKPDHELPSVIISTSKYMNNQLNGKNINDIISLGSLSILSLYVYLIDSSMSFEEANPNKIIINTGTLIQVLNNIINWNISVSSKKLFKDLTVFILELLSFIIDMFIKEKLPLPEDLIKVVFNIISWNTLKTQVKYTYSYIITILRTNLLPNYQWINNTEIFNWFFNYLITFSTNEQTATLIFKLCVILYNSRDIAGDDHKKFIMNKIVYLCTTAKNGKITSMFFDFCVKLINLSKHEKHVLMSGLYEYSSKYDNALIDSILNHSIEKMDNIMEKNWALMPFDDEMFFIISLFLNLYKKERSERLFKLIEVYFVRNKFEKVWDKIIEKIHGNVRDKKEEDLLYVNEQMSVCDNYNEIKNKIKWFDFTSYVNSASFGNNAICWFGILQRMSELISEFIAHYLTLKSEYDISNDNENNSENNFPRNSEIEDEPSILNEEKIKKIDDAIENFFEYFNNFWLNQPNKTSAKGVVVNEVLSNSINLNYFTINDTNRIAEKLIKEEKTDYSHWEEFKIKIINKKNKEIFNYISINKYTCIIFNTLLQTCFENDTKMWSKFIKPCIDTGAKQHFIFNTIWSNDIFTQQGLTGIKENTKIMLNSYFINYFRDNIMFIEDMVNNQPIFLYLLDYEIFNNYFMNQSHLLNYDLIALSFYTLLAADANNLYLKQFWSFIKLYVQNNKNLHLFMLRWFSKPKTFNKIISTSDDNKIMFEIWNDWLDNLMTYNSYHTETLSTISEIISTVKDYITRQIYYNKISNEVIYIGNILLNMYKKILKIGNSENNKYEINPKFKTHLLEELQSEILPNYINDFYTITEKIFGESNQIFDLNYIYDYFEIIIEFKQKNIVKDLLLNISKDNVRNFITVFTQYTKQELSNSMWNSLINKYVEGKVGDIERGFIEFFIWNYWNSKGVRNKKEIIKNAVLVFKDDPQRQKFAFLCVGYYFHCCAEEANSIDYSSDKDNNNNNIESNSAFNNVTLDDHWVVNRLNWEDFEICVEIGKRMSQEVFDQLK